mgnify:CR=1 FL=1
MSHILAVLICAAAVPVLAQELIQGGPNAAPAFLLQRQTDDLVLRPGERCSGLSLLERDQVITAIRGWIPGIVFETVLDFSETT